VNESKPAPQCHAGQARLLLVGHRVPGWRSFHALSNPGPLALSVLIAFALSPVVKRIERRPRARCGHRLVAVVALAAVTAFGYLLKHSACRSFDGETKYSESMRKKVSALRAPRRRIWLDCPEYRRVSNSWIERVVEDREARP